MQNNKTQEIKAIIITGSSATGKGEQVKKYFKYFPHRLSFSVSMTTRPKRDTEKEAVHYFFVNESRFLSLVSKNHFAEWHRNKNGHLYGTLISEIDRINKMGKIALFETEIHGALALIKLFENEVYTVHLYASPEEKRKRLNMRGTENPEDIEKRIAEGEFHKNLFFENSQKFDCSIDTTSLSIREIFEKSLEPLRKSKKITALL